MNKYLKEVGNRAGLKETVAISITKGGMRMDRNYKKFVYIS
jgi:hypothetical protein